MSFEEYKQIEIEQKTEGILLSDMNLSFRTYNCLRRGGYEKLIDVMLEDPCKFTQLKHFGEKSNEELQQMISFVRNATTDDLRAYVDLKIDMSNMREINNDGEKTVIEVALDRVVNLDKILFKDADGIMQEDILLIELPLSNRTINFCNEKEILSIRQIASMDYFELKNARGIGTTCLNEVLGLFRQLAVPTNIIDDGVRSRINKLTLNICNHYSELLAGEDLDSIIAQMKYNIFALCIEGEKIDSLEAKDFSHYITMQPILDVITKKVGKDAAESFVEGTDFKMLGNKYGFSTDMDFASFEQIIRKLEETRKVRLIENKVYKYKLFFAEWLESIDGSLKRAMECRCSGDTLEEVGTKMGLTRERVRQIISKGIKRTPTLYEEDYASIFQKYNFSDEQYSELFKFSMFQINYLKMKHKKGNCNVQEFLDDEKVPLVIKERVGNVFKDKMIIIDGVCVPLKREILLERILKKYFSDEECTIEEFEKVYTNYLSENNLNKNGALLFPNSRAFEARVIDYPYSLCKLGKRIRYYDTTKVDINRLLQQIDISQYNNTEISTRKIFCDYPEVMDNYDIRDEYELHNLLRKRLDSIDCASITITRMPFITIGIADRFRQVKELLYQYAPITNTALAEIYEDRYGVQKETVLANFFVNIDIYFHDGIFDIEQKELPSDVFIKMKKILTEDIYLWEDVKRLYKSVSNNQNDDSINAMNLKMLGYRIYSQYVISNRFPSADSYITNLLTVNDRIDINEIDAGIRKQQVFYSTMTNLRDSLELIEIDKDIFVTFSFFCDEYCNTSKEELALVGAKLVQNQGTYFSINELANRGLCDFDFGVPNNVYFLNSIIRIQEGIKTTKMGEVYIASHGEELSHLGLITYLVSELGDLNVYKVISTIQDKFGIKLERNRIIYVLEENHEYYYDGVFDMVCKGQPHMYNDAEDFWSSENGVRVISGMEIKIKETDISISKVFWKDKYSRFVEICADRFMFEMKDILNINFDELWRNSSNNGLSRNIVPEIMVEFSNWVESLKMTETLEDESIFDLFFK